MRDQVAVVTGAASGIGAAIAQDFAAQGCRVALLDINETQLHRTAADIAAGAPGTVRPITVDIADSTAVKESLAELVAGWGGISYLASCAVSFVAAGVDATQEQWDRVLQVNVRGTAMVLAACVPYMLPGSAAVNTASISAHVAQPDRWTYNATKGAIVSMTRCQALDLAPRGIRVNVVSPGWIWTPEVLRAAQDDREAWEPVWGPYHILRRLGEPHEVARAVLFLCSDDASFITGTELMVDGGYSALSAEGLGQTSQFAGTA
ncbi:short-chain dehydrogenase [Actinoplanes sp. SE50]|nr:short chain dehydrogenase [Actinoplanes sp. SE50/110]ATO83461.1 short-chain dehydrogenase [Actinoplanes sp. SE50]SLM00868.1 short-chain dehydrogenase [Actinoplanes sp. SE50/110]